MRLVVISLNLLLILSFFDMAITSDNSTNDQSVDLVRLNNITKEIKGTIVNNSEVDSNISVTEAKIDDQNVNELSRNLTDFDNSTESDDNEIDKIHSSFNLAIIPAAAVFVFVIIICFKCCKWFRQYTRADDKENNFYAVIVTEDDYEHVDITSDTASTVCYDTVSSNGSFLKRSGNESSLSSIKFWRQGSFKGDKGLSPNVEKIRKSTGGRQELIQSPASSVNTRAKAKDSFAEPDFRISSTSSAETISEPICDSPAIRRNNRFRVSFVTEPKSSGTNSAQASETRPISNNNFKQENPMRSSLKKSSPKNIPNETVISVSQKGNERVLGEKIKMKDVGTQTNKSFRYSLRKTKGHASDTDIDERLFSGLDARTLALKTDETKRTDINNSGETINMLTKHTKHSSISTPGERNISFSTEIPDISHFQFNTEVDVIQNNSQQNEYVVDLELEDDVFVEDLFNESSPSRTERPKVSASCDCDRRNNKENTKDQINMSENVSCSECSDRKNIIKQNCDKLCLNVLDKESSSEIQRICNKCRAEYEDKQDSSGQGTDRVSLQNSSEVHSRHSSNFSLESSGYAELSSNESCSSSPIITTHRV